MNARLEKNHGGAQSAHPPNALQSQSHSAGEDPQMTQIFAEQS
jgi:hypothetical protein